MSLLWRDEVAIYLAPRKLAMVRRARGLKARVVAATELAVSAGAAGDLGPVLARLAGVLTDSAWHGAAARVVVADQSWARYAIVPWTATRLDAEGRLTHARYVLSDAHGEAVASWAVTLADGPPGHSCVACAMPALLRGALEDTLAPARLSLLSLQPKLVVAFNAFRQRLPRDDAWFVTLDDGSLSAVHLSGGRWDRVHLARLSPDPTIELERLRAFGTLTGGAGAPCRMFVDAPAWMRGGTGKGFEWLEAADGGLVHELALLRGMRA